jgi:hypothetical protein
VEYFEISKAFKGIKFMFYLLFNIGIDVELPVVMKTDNIGAMFMTQKASMGVRKYHVYAHYHLIISVVNAIFYKEQETYK